MRAVGDNAEWQEIKEIECGGCLASSDCADWYLFST